MKQVLSLLLLGLIMTSCSTEEVQTNQSADASLQLVTATNDFSNLGIYKGVFAAPETSLSGTLIINAGQDQTTAVLSLTDKTEILFTANSSFTADLNPQSVTLESKSGTFNFKVNSDGTNPTVSNVTLFSTVGSILVAKETSTTAINAITGTYGCDDCADHPILSNLELQDTFIWNMIFEDDGVGEDLVTSQVTFGPSTVVSLGNQENPYAKIGDLIYSEMEGRFRFGAAGQVTWDATHMLSMADACNSIVGNWTLTSPAYTINGWLRNDLGCNNPG